MVTAATSLGGPQCHMLSCISLLRCISLQSQHRWTCLSTPTTRAALWARCTSLQPLGCRAFTSQNWDQIWITTPFLCKDTELLFSLVVVVDQESTVQHRVLATSTGVGVQNRTENRPACTVQLRVGWPGAGLSTMFTSR